MKRKTGDRVWLIDEVRGLAILLMVVYHTFFDLVVVFGVDIPVFFSPFVQFLAILFAGLFVFISGTACHYSRNNPKRGAVCFGLGMLLTVVTLLVLPSERVLFGILHMLGVCMMLFPLFRPLIKRLSPWVGCAACLLLFLLCYSLPDGYIGLPGLFSFRLPRMPYDAGFLFWLGFPPPGFFSSDYFPLLPWLFCFLAGAFFGIWVKEGLSLIHI